MGIRYAVNHDFFKKWSNEMAYVLGYIYADGNLEDAAYLRGKYVRATSTDRDRVEAIKSLMASDHTIVENIPGGNRKPRYLLRIGSHVLYNDLLTLGVTPRKSLVMRFPDVPRKFVAAFVRGYFDGDGCVYLDRFHKNKNLAHVTPRRLMVIFTSGSQQFLESLHRVICDICGIAESCLHEHNKPGAYQLRYSTTSSVQIFSFMYRAVVDPRLYLSRKYAIFRQFFDERGDWISNDIRRVLAKKWPRGEGVTRGSAKSLLREFESRRGLHNQMID